jgi:acetyl esterase
MQLDPQMKAILDQFAAAGGKPIHEMTPAEARAAIDAMIGAFRTEPKVVSKIEDRKIPGPAGDIPVRVYTPAGKGPFGALVYFHGGGWVVGSVEAYDGICRELASGAGCITVSVEYRLAPEHKFPAAPEDCYAATKWVAENERALNIDAKRIAVGGDSAGGNLSAVVSQMARDRGGPKLAFQLLIYPVTDGVNETPSQREFTQDGYILSHADMEWFYGHYVSAKDRTNPYACPALANSLAGLPPAYVLTAQVDPLRDEGESYGKALQKAGVNVKAKRYDGVCHGFIFWSSVLDAARQGFADCCAELRSVIGK